jgi:hypothetical protein
MVSGTRKVRVRVKKISEEPSMVKWRVVPKRGGKFSQSTPAAMAVNLR